MGREEKKMYAEHIPDSGASWVEKTFGKDAFSRFDPSDDAIFYGRDRFVQHLDSAALETVEAIIGNLVIEKNPAILDLMASWDSHIPVTIQASRIAGLGLNRNELEMNPSLTEFVIHDLNRDPTFPFAEASFDAVINTVSVDYMTRPVEVFREVGRILRPGGLFLVIFSTRMFPQKATRIWREAGEDERVVLVEEFFRYAELFESSEVFISKGKPRPEDDKYSHLGIPSDPVYAVYADKKGSAGNRKKRSGLKLPDGDTPSPDILNERKRRVKHTLECPHCEEKMRKWEVPNTPFTQWDNEYMYVCFNDSCPYLMKGWEVMNQQGNRGISYRLMYDPKRDNCMPVPVHNLKTMKDGIIG
jgi:SAM-dependent methyltransferase